MKHIEIMILADLLDGKLKEFNINGIIDPKEQSKYRNLNKSLSYFIEYIDNKLKSENMQTEFAELCDNYELINTKQL